METTRKESVQPTSAWCDPPSQILPAVLVGAAWRPAAEPGSMGTAAGGRHTPSAPGRVLEGEVRGMDSRKEDDAAKRGWEVWTFRLERFDHRGNRLQPVPVMMHGRCFSGFLADGQVVRVARYQRRGDIVRTRRVLNVTTGARVVAHRRPRGSGTIWLLAAALVVVMLAVAAQVAGTLRQGDSQVPPTGSTPAGVPAPAPGPFGDLGTRAVPVGRGTDIADSPARRPAPADSAELDGTIAELPVEVEEPEGTAVEELDEATIPNQGGDADVINRDEIEIVR